MPSKIRKDRPLKIATKPTPKAPGKPTLLQRLGQALKDHDWHKHPNEFTPAWRLQEHKIRQLVRKCVAEYSEVRVRQLWAEHVPAKLPTPFGLKPAKVAKPDRKLKGAFNDARRQYDRRKQLGLPDPAGEVINHDRIAEGLARGQLLSGEGNVHTIAEHVLRRDLITLDDVRTVLGEKFAYRVESEMVRLRATEVLEPGRNGTPTKETYPVANMFTFKKEPLDTRAAASRLASKQTTIKRKGKDCGTIVDHGKNGWGVDLQIIKDEDHNDGNPNCPWMWLSINRRFEAESDARQWLQANGKRITRAYTLWLGEDHPSNQTAGYFKTVRGTT